MPPGRPQVKHGRAAYVAKRCDCVICREAVRAYSDKRRREHGAKIAVGPWTVQDFIILAEPTTAKECAEKLGRTVYAVEKMRAQTGLGGPRRRGGKSSC